MSNSLVPETRVLAVASQVCPSLTLPSKEITNPPPQVVYGYVTSELRAGSVWSHRAVTSESPADSP
jgi:hypothetical protein